jgi:hypothetical protein
MINSPLLKALHEGNRDIMEASATDRQTMSRNIITDQQ